MENLKSKYIVKIIFSLIIEKVKLEMVKYNKSLQIKLDISIINYKIFSGKFIVDKNIGLTKEYSLNGELIYEGEYLKGKRNGKGKEYDSEGILIYEGEYLNGKKNGKGKVYDPKGNLIFVGEYMNGKIWNGKGKEYRSQGIRNGKGKVYYPKDNFIFIGEYLNWKIWNGKGKGNFYSEVEYLNGKKWNVNFFNVKNQSKYSLIDGKGFIIEYIGANSTYNEFNDFNEIFGAHPILEYSGFSTYRFPIIFEGEYLNGERNGKGKEYLLSPFVLDPILIYEGEYLNGKRNGKGKEYDSKGILIFEGEYLNGKKWSGIGPSAPKKVLPPEGEIFGIDYIKGRKFVIKDGKGFSIELFKAWLSIAFFISEYLNGERNGKGIGYI